MNDSRSGRQSRRSTPRSPKNGRELAYAVLDEYKRTSALAAPLLDELGERANIAPLDRRLARELVLGVIRRQATLNALVEPHVSRPRHQVEGQLWTLLQMGAYQLALMDSVPPHAAVHETVEVARSVGKQRWCGMLNGVLRSVAGSVSDVRTNSPAADAFPVAIDEYRKCDRAILPDPAVDECGYFARAFSFPDWLAKRWHERYEFGELCRLGFWLNQPPHICLRVNTLRTTRDEFLAALSAAGVDAHVGAVDAAIWLNSSMRVEELPGFREGWFVVQDESAMHAAHLVAPAPGESILDLCAAPGTKTTHIAALMQNRGTIVACDVRQERLNRVTENSRRLGIEIIQPTLMDKDGSQIPQGPFDAVLVDVPCSNTGVLGKRPEARWRIKPNDFPELAEIQQRLLLSACDRVKPGGRVVYSTCSIDPVENQNVVQAAAEARPEIELVQAVEHVPGRPGDGGYQALLRRRLA